MDRTHFRLRAIGIALLLAPAIVLAQNPPESVEAHQAAQTPSVAGYAKRTVGVRAFAMSAMGATVTQGTNTPAEWGQGAAGFGRRFASAYGKHIVGNIIRYPIARLRHEELSYRPSGKHGFRPRLMYALESVVITHKTTTGKRTTNVSEISGALGSGLISRLWQPASTGTIALGFSSAGTSLAVDAGIRVLREFWPEIRHPHQRNPPVAPTATAAAEEIPELAASESNGESVSAEFSDEASPVEQ